MIENNNAANSDNQFSASRQRDISGTLRDEQFNLPLSVRIGYGLPDNNSGRTSLWSSSGSDSGTHYSLPQIALVNDRGEARTGYGGNAGGMLGRDGGDSAYRDNYYSRPGAFSDAYGYNQGPENARDILVTHEMREMELLIEQTQAIVNLLNAEINSLRREMDLMLHDFYRPTPPFYPMPEPRPWPQPQPLPEPQPRPEPQPPFPQPRPQPGPEPLPPHPVPEPGPYPRPEPQPGPQPRPEPQPEPRPEPQPQPLPEPRPRRLEDEKRHHGVNLSGAEFGESSLPGRPGSDYVFPTTQELDYYKQKGIDLIRLPFFWERMQPGLLNKYSPDASVDRSFDPGYASQMDNFLKAADERGLKVIPDAQQFGRYKHQVIGASNITNEDFKQFWSQMAQRFGSHPSIYGWDLSNEPHDEDSKTWHDAAQAGLDGIRASGDKHSVVVEGNQWSGAWSWQQYNNDLAVQDPENNVVYSAHSYWDTNHSGSYDGGAPGSFDRSVAEARRQNYLSAGEDSSNIGINQTKPFVEWLKKHNARGFIGEYGVPQNDPNWIKAQDKFLAYAKANGIDTAAWGGGPWWGKDYALSLETGPKGEQSVSGPEPLNMKSVENDGNGY